MEVRLHGPVQSGFPPLLSKMMLLSQQTLSCSQSWAAWLEVNDAAALARQLG
ncbi:hypothetical protein [Kosakonia arachidis]|uniref:hypothetical protein n=1 Tax=Kosakonia arachidis TaxID=551989 RepID=UPI001C316A49|nr:hypothetical protein [Kosakonia arachidis]